VDPASQLAFTVRVDFTVSVTGSYILNVFTPFVIAVILGSRGSEEVFDVKIPE
jgi:hypothetical protein